MKKNKSKECLQCFHLIFSIILIVISVSLFIGTLFIKSKFSPYTEYLNDYSSKPVLYLLVGSAVLTVAGFVGIVSVIQDWIRGIITFTFFIIYLLLSMIALIITAYILSTSVDERMLGKIKADMSNYDINKNIIDNLQLKFSCCGVNNFTEWNETLGRIPGSCCNSDAYCDYSELLQLQLPGCYSALINIVKYLMKIIFPILATLGIVKILSIIVSILLIVVMKRHRKKTMKSQRNIEDSVQLPRIHNPLGQNASEIIEIPKSPSVSEPVYVRRPIERPIILAYKSPHENYLHRPPQYRFDCRRASNSRINSPQSSKVYDSFRYS